MFFLLLPYKTTRQFSWPRLSLEFDFDFPPILLLKPAGVVRSLSEMELVLGYSSIKEIIKSCKVSELGLRRNISKGPPRAKEMA